ncbi:hypothetical protein C8J56DRAFT_907526 [Mycena floridula]|nr:hypothetical protein C8J56DRAFT_907526 [Mycena floridula]
MPSPCNQPVYISSLEQERVPQNNMVRPIHATFIRATAPLRPTYNIHTSVSTRTAGKGCEPYQANRLTKHTKARTGTKTNEAKELQKAKQEKENTDLKANRSKRTMTQAITTFPAVLF